MIKLRGGTARAVLHMVTPTDTYRVCIMGDDSNGSYVCEKNRSNRALYDSKLQQLDGETVLEQHLEVLTVRLNTFRPVDDIKSIVRGSVFENFFSGITHGATATYGFLHRETGIPTDIIPNQFMLNVLFPDAFLPYAYWMYGIAEDELIMTKIHNIDTSSWFNIKNVKAPIWEKVFGWSTRLVTGPVSKTA